MSSSPFLLPLLALLTVGCVAEPSPDADCSDGACDIVGEDGRKDWYQISGTAFAPGAGKTWRSIGKSVVALVPKDNLNRRRTLAQKGICSSEPFAEQQSFATCSGLLVGEDLVLTAGHCVDERRWQELVAVFDFRMRTKDQVEAQGGVDRVYEFENLLSAPDSVRGDFALLRLKTKLERPAHSWVRWSEPQEDESIHVLGHPAGLPLKYSFGAARSGGHNNEEEFQHDADTVGGSSGSPVFDSEGYLIGVHSIGHSVSEETRLTDFGCYKYTSGIWATNGATRAPIALNWFCDSEEGRGAALCEGSEL